MRDREFSVVVPTFGRPALLAEAVASVLAQSVSDLECIVVDDAGEPPAILDTDDVRVRVIRHERNRGLSAARNTGIAAARGAAVAFLDDDDLLATDRLAIAREGLSRAPVAICFRGNHPGGGPGRNRVLEGDVRDVIADRAVPHVGQACVARDALVPFDESLRAGEEVDWWLRLSSRRRVTTVPRIGYLFRIHAGARSGNGAAVRARSRQRVLALHAEYFRAHPSAEAFQWMRVGLLAEQAGDRSTARRAFARSLRRRPSPNVAWHLGRTLVAGGRA